MIIAKSLRGLEMKTKKEFCKVLRRLLLWKYNSNEIKTIIGEYEEYFDTGKSFGKSEGKICAELGSPLAIVREVNLENEYKVYLRYLLNKRVMIRLSILAILVSLFMWTVYKGAWTQLEDNSIFSLYPVLSILGWHLLGGKLFSLTWLGYVKDPYRAIKITVVHSIYLLMAILSFCLITKVFLSWDIIYARNSGSFSQLKAKTIYILFMVFIMTVGIMVASLYEYRYHGIEYYSLICHGIGLACTVLEYTNILNRSEYWQRGIDVILNCEGVYVESIILSSLFLIYSQYIKKS